MNQDAVNKSVLVLMVIAISALFLTMIEQFLMAIFLAGLFSALARPVYRRLKVTFNGHRHLASITTLLLMIVVVLIPLMLLIGIIVGQAIDVGQSITPWIKQTIEQPDRLSAYLQHLPFYDQLVPYREIILEKAGKIVGSISKWIVGGLSSGNPGHGQLPVHVICVSVHHVLLPDGWRQADQKDSLLSATEQRR